VSVLTNVANSDRERVASIQVATNGRKVIGVHQNQGITGRLLIGLSMTQNGYSTLVNGSSRSNAWIP